MKKILSILLVLAMIFTFAACGSKEAETTTTTTSTAATTTTTETKTEEVAEEPTGIDALDPITIEFATPNAEANIESEYAKKWVDAVEAASNGKITFNYTPGGALGTYDELLEGTINGVYDMTITEPSYIATYVPESALLSLPMLYSSYEEANWVLDGEVGEWYNGLVQENAGLDVLNYFYCGFRYIISEDEIKTLDDCQDVIIRSPNIQTYLDTLGMLGFKCETMAFSEAYTAMETGVISAVECPLQNLYSNGYYNLCDYLLGSRHLLSANCIIANDEFWSSIPEEYKTILTDCIAEITTEERTECEARENQFIEDFAAEGTTFNEFDDASMTKIVEMFSAYWNEQVEALGDDAVAMLDKIIANK